MDPQRKFNLIVVLVYTAFMAFLLLGAFFLTGKMA
jgi:preprotein translocase subunit SecE